MTDLRLERPNRVESYTDTELAKLWPQMEALKYEDVYIYVARAAVATGARLGELVALNRDDLRLGERELDIQHHYDMTDGMTTPKNGYARTNFLIEDTEADAINAVGLFERWTRHVGVQLGDAPIFPAPRSGGRLNAQYLRKLVDKARREAGIPDVGRAGGLKNVGCPGRCRLLAKTRQGLAVPGPAVGNVSTFRGEVVAPNVVPMLVDGRFAGIAFAGRIATLADVGSRMPDIRPSPRRPRARTLGTSC